jgi:hypothetical protein
MKRIILVLLAMVSLVVISGCYRPNWYRANTTYAELKADSEWCKSQTNIGSARAKMIDQYERCMQNKGYGLKGKDPYSGEPKSTSNQPRRGTDTGYTGWEGDRQEEYYMAFNSPWGDTTQYHRIGCPYGPTTSQVGVKLSKEQVKAKGLKPCPICKPLEREQVVQPKKEIVAPETEPSSVFGSGRKPGLDTPFGRDPGLNAPPWSK